ncbi:MBL fold metallo-hydrolase [Calothrix sp. 336/3]|uniref:MBL fold metallo-hydrolase n=1 Tax=Calothrix sp. 336/3 TaxID=1337936 RepID=UPI0004E30F11|nr:MBL fold metallo-hydrolase [Calothrix sp. 336/3]AKG22881.1 beta-lactamase [Calothrix sp. 336/3]
MCPLPPESNQTITKSPQIVFNSIFAFPPNRDTLGGTAYFIVRNEGNILIDSPAWDESYQSFMDSQGGIRWLIITHRGAIGKAVEYQKAFNCEIIIQEQEAYLIPEAKLTTFHRELTLNPTTKVIWTPGHSPGSACVYHNEHGGILFSGRHLLPNQQGEPAPFKTAKTFHWHRQIRSVKYLLENFSPENLAVICPGANTGFLRGKRVINHAYQQLAALDLAQLWE